MKLKDIAEKIDYGLTEKAKNEKVGPKFLRITDIQNNRVNWDTVPFCLCDEKEFEKNKLESGDIVFARTGATTGKSFLIDQLNEDAVYASYLIRLRLNQDEVLPEFVSYFFNSDVYWRQIYADSNGATLPSFNATKLKKLEIPLPTLTEQKAIVAKLDRAQRLIDIDREMLAKYDELIQSVFLEMFGDPVTNPKGWEIKKGKTLFNFKSGKYLKKELLDDSFEYPVYGGNGVRGYYDDFLVDYPTLIIGRVGAKCGVIHSIKNESWITDNAIFLEDFAYPNKVNFYYNLLKLLNINQYADYSGQPKITQKPLENLDVINPSQHLILHFEKVYSRIIDEKEKLESSLKKSEELFSSLVQGVFG